MQLDQAQIAIRERSWSENLDLALHVLRTHGVALAGCALVGILPAALFNHSAIVWANSGSIAEVPESRTFYFLMILVMIETPLVTAPITLYLGRALFVAKPRPRELARDFVSCLPQLILLQLILRTILIVPVITWIIPYALWPYLNEVILLERNPLIGRRGQISTLKRNSLLHRSNSGDFIAQSLGAGCLAAMLVAALIWTQGSLLENLLGLHLGSTARTVEVQIAMWLVAIYFTVARFLGYLDQRIRNEGWEVELLLRAERERLVRQIG